MENLRKKTRGDFFAIKQFLSAFTSISAGLTVRKILNLKTLLFPKNYAFLFLFATLALFLASLGFWPIKEPKIHKEEGKRDLENTYLLDISPEDHRAVYVGINGSLVIFTMILPLIGGGLIENFGYYTTFLLVSIGMFINYILTWV